MRDEEQWTLKYKQIVHWPLPPMTLQLRMLLIASLSKDTTFELATALYTEITSLQLSRSDWVVYTAVLAVCGMGSHGFEPQTSTNACGHVCRYVDQKGSVAMLTSIQSAGVTPEVNLRNSLHAGDKACKQGIHPGFETQGRHYQKSKTGVSVTPQKGLMSSKNFKKNKEKEKEITTFFMFNKRSTTQQLDNIQTDVCEFKPHIFYRTFLDMIDPRNTIVVCVSYDVSYHSPCTIPVVILLIYCGLYYVFHWHDMGWVPVWHGPRTSLKSIV